MLTKERRLRTPRPVATSAWPPSWGPQAQDEPHGKAFFAFLGGLACDLEGVGAAARQLSNSEVCHS
ncbi:hypothetical protein BBV17_27120 [Cytobacillus oceanisediminis]|uniref:Uncharacterized protein n=1 Tax=Cytobacillus oceanisediminis TaxID=665099 RepID=A0ABX3CL20_9BACI|nr:hypothetical protein BBV17_27120 [Cytobacillus oceanisediminis]